MDEKAQSLKHLGWSDDLIRHFLVPMPGMEVYEPVQAMVHEEGHDSSTFIFSAKETTLHGTIEARSK